MCSSKVSRELKYFNETNVSNLTAAPFSEAVVGLGMRQTNNSETDPKSDGNSGLIL